MKVFSHKPCVVCEKPFRPTSSKQVCCSPRCKSRKKNIELKKHLLRFFEPSRASNIKETVKLLKDTKYKIEDEYTTESEESPTGRVYIGVAKRPLALVKKGHGFKGVLLQTDNRMFVQCHICGKWNRRISATHLKTHKLTGSCCRKNDREKKVW